MPHGPDEVGVGPWEGELPEGEQYDPELLANGDDVRAAKLGAQRTAADPSTRTAGPQLLPLVLDGSLVVDQTFLALAHELLEHRLELRVGAPAGPWRRRILQGLDREVDLSVLLDRDDLGLNDVALAKMLVDVRDVIPVDLRDMNEPEASVLQLQESAIWRYAFHGAVHHRSDLYLRYLDPFRLTIRSTANRGQAQSVGSRLAARQ